MGVLTGQVKGVYLTDGVYLAHVYGPDPIHQGGTIGSLCKCQLPVSNWLLKLRANRQSPIGNQQSKWLIVFDQKLIELIPKSGLKIEIR